MSGWGERPSFVVECRRRRLHLGPRTFLMGVLNVTPDSFWDGGRFLKLDDALAQARAMAREGADIIDVGGESARPGSQGVSLEEELSRVVPVVEALTRELDVAVSVDTSKAEVARQALEAGAHLVNDVTALRGDTRMGRTVREMGAGLVLMHMKGTPLTMQRSPEYADVMGEVIEFLREALSRAESDGILLGSTIVDPGIGFGKTVGHNLELLRRLDELHVLGRPVLLGPSRKSVVGAVLGLPAEERLEGTGAAVAASVLAGVHIVRVHDVREMSRVAKMADAIRAGISYEAVAAG